MVMPNLIRHPGYLDCLFRGNDADGRLMEFVITCENRLGRFRRREIVKKPLRICSGLLRLFGSGERI